MADSTDALSSPTVTKGKRKVGRTRIDRRFSSFRQGTKREAELDDVSPTKLKALKATRNGTNGEATVNDDVRRHKNGDEHGPEDDDDEDDDVRRGENKCVNDLDDLLVFSGGRRRWRLR